MRPPVKLPAAPVPHGLQKKGEKLDIHGLFELFNVQYFCGELQGVYVEYSPKMTLCAGTCTFRGRAGGCRIALSEPLLLLRPAEDTVATLLHEMIHARLFLKYGVERDSPDGHGPRFLGEAERVGKLAGVEITVYHSFKSEVESHQRHWWTCDQCGRVVKRSMNRSPAPTDNWWPEHVRSCGGEFRKSHEPPARERPSKHSVVSVGEGDGLPSSQKTWSTGKGVVRVRRIDELFQSKADIQSSPAPSQPSSSLMAPATGQFSCPACSKGPFRTEAAVSDHLDLCVAGVFSSQVEPVPVEPVQQRRHEKKHTNVYESHERSPRVHLPDSVIDLDDEVENSVANTSPDKTTSGSRWTRWMDEGDSAGAIDYRVPDAKNDIRNIVHLNERVPEPREGLNRRALDSEPGVGLPPVGTVTVGSCSLNGDEFWACTETNALLDFALGIGGPCVPEGPMKALSAFGRSDRLPEPENNQTAPSLPPFPHVVNRKKQISELNARLKLWQPGSSSHEPIFASSAARLGLTTSQLMEELRKLSNCESATGSFVLSNEARGTLLEGKRLRACGGVEERSHGVVSMPLAKRRRHVEKNDRPHLQEGGRLKKLIPSRVEREASSRTTSEAPVRIHVPTDTSKFARGSRVIGDFFSKGDLVQDVSAAGGKVFGRGIASLTPHDGKEDVSPKTVAGRPNANVSTPKQQKGKPDAGTTTSCPLCSVVISTAKINAHLELCMAGSQDQSVIDLDLGTDDPSSMQGRAVNVIPVSKTQGTLPTVDRSAVHEGLDKQVITEDNVECPVCSQPMRRSALASHIDACMAGEGLADLFE